MQSIQLPFALIPLIKFVASPKIMGMFAIDKYNAYFAILFGIFLFGLNFRVIFIEFQDQIYWWHALLFIVYIGLIFKVVTEPVTDLEKMT